MTLAGVYVQGLKNCLDVHSHHRLWVWCMDQAFKEKILVCIYHSCFYYDAMEDLEDYVPVLQGAKLFPLKLSITFTEIENVKKPWPLGCDNDERRGIN